MRIRKKTGNEPRGRFAGSVYGRALRRLIVPRTPRSTPIEVIQAALRRDSITLAFQNGPVLLKAEVVVDKHR